MLTEDPFMNSAIWFFSGVLCHKFLTALLKITKLTFLFQEMLIYSLSILRVADSHMDMARDVKYKALSEKNNEISPEELEEIKRYDETFVREWRSGAIDFILKNSPDSFRGILKFSNWFQAMKYLERVYKRKGL